MDKSFLTKYWDINEHISIPEIVARAAVMFLVTMLIIRLSGMRSFRKNTPFDVVIAFLIGGVLSRGVVGATPFFSALAGGIALIVLQKLFLKLSLENKWFENVLKGERYIVFKDGKFLKKNMRHADITTLEVFEDLRAEHGTNSLESIREIYVEKSGEITFVKK